MKQYHFFVFVFFYIGAVLYLAITTPITPHEAKIFYSSQGILNHLMHWGDALKVEGISTGFLGFRLFFILLGFLTLILFHKLSKDYFHQSRDVYLATSLFMLLPGVLTASIVANVAIIVLPLVLAFVLLYERGYFYLLPFLLLALFFVHEASIIFFISIFLYAMTHKDRGLAILSMSFLLAFIYLAKGIEIGGRPSGHFIEIFGLYAALFSPLLFLYFFYALYRILLREKKRLVWYISFTALAFSLLLSIRQRIYITDFAPYVVIAIVLMLDTFNQSVRVRIPRFQKGYILGFYVVIVILIVSFVLILFHKHLYYFGHHIQRPLFDRIYAPYELALTLKSRGVTCYDGIRGRTRYQLYYYGIDSCSKPLLQRYDR